MFVAARRRQEKGIRTARFPEESRLSRLRQSANNPTISVIPRDEAVRIVCELTIILRSCFVNSEMERPPMPRMVPIFRQPIVAQSA
jgi:hypothetical protein